VKDRIYITKTDLEKLQSILENRVPADAEERRNLERLEEELDRAEVVSRDQLPTNVITMHSEVQFQDLDTREVKQYKLVFPSERVPGSESVSILAPLGTALLGYTAGSTIHWPVPKGIRRLKVLKIVQPHAAAAA
jgi:regulator of nucleoside diphosphate kinase